MKVGAVLSAALAAASFSLFIPGVYDAAAGEANKAAVVRPSKGFTLDVGSKHAVGHFRQVKGKCDVTLMIAEKAAAEDAVVGAGSRLSMTVVPGKPARLDTAEGKSLLIGCTPAAAAITVKVIDRAA